jgi:tRNA pseudouridine38-40 synthase
VEITDISVKMQGDLIVITISGSHFLWNMIRRMIGILVEIGRGKQSPDIIPSLLKKKSDMPASFTAPPSGLFLASVRYENDPVKKVQSILNIS